MSRAITIDPRKLQHNVIEAIQFGRKVVEKCQEVVVNVMNQSKESLRYDSMPIPGQFELTGIDQTMPVQDIFVLDSASIKHQEKQVVRETIRPIKTNLAIEYNPQHHILPEPVKIETDNLVEFIEQTGQQVSAVDTLPSGIDRISVNEWMEQAKKLEPVPVRSKRHG